MPIYDKEKSAIRIRETRRVAESCCKSGIWGSGLCHSQLAAHTLNNLELRNRFQELKAVAEGVTLSYHSMDLNLAAGESELKPHYFAHRHFIEHHCGNSGFAEVDRVPAHYLRAVRVDAHRDFDLIARMAARINH